MDTEAFWTLIDDSLGHAPGRAAREEYLRARLAESAPEEIVGFQLRVNTACIRADGIDLWGAAARIMSGFCSDDGFEYFRLWLIGRGREVFEQALANPDSLATTPEIQRLVGRPLREWDEDVEWPDWETLAYIAADAYAAATGEQDEDAFDDAVSEHDEGVEFPDYLAEEQWNPRDEELAAAKIPNLARAFPLAV